MSEQASIIICRGPSMKIVRDDQDGEPRWCFTCRKVREFRFIVKAPVEPSYYGPAPNVSCAECGTRDSDLFPGREREWEL